jgi:hypothetical protein
MAVYQTTYGEAPAIGLHGQIASEEKCNKISRTVENAAGVRFGEPVQRGAGDHGVVPLAADGEFIGIAVLNPAVPPVAAGSTLVDGYPQYFTGAFMTMGAMKVAVSAAVTQGSEVYYNTANNTYTGATGANIVGPLPGVVFDTSAASGGIAEIAMALRPVAAA